MFSASIFDQAGFLQRVGHERHARPTHAQHLSEKFLRQRQIVAAGKVAHMEQPATHAGLDRMTGVARCRLLRLREQHLLMLDEQGPERFEHSRVFGS